MEISFTDFTSTFHYSIIRGGGSGRSSGGGGGRFYSHRSSLPFLAEWKRLILLKCQSLAHVNVEGPISIDSDFRLFVLLRNTENPPSFPFFLKSDWQDGIFCLFSLFCLSFNSTPLTPYTRRIRLLGLRRLLAPSRPILIPILGRAQAHTFTSVC